MAIKINVNRKHWEKVELTDEDGNKGVIEVQFRSVTKEDSQEIKIVDLITDIKGLELCDDDGNRLSFEDTVATIHADDELSLPIIKAYTEGKRTRLGLNKTSKK